MKRFTLLLPALFISLTLILGCNPATETEQAAFDKLLAARKK